ncbi:uncharacterized protein LOC127832151 [Dreissena polymorpha]|uniref:uncharacterized protein LOC127832151 n=1 Tax=Dreissena polymorpha TaxID=45954 RepID=UPI0022646AF7|nr:uncharacterized protein LOC127832151 [Dreissena polymorpha]
MAEHLQTKLHEEQCRRALNRAHKKIASEMDPNVVLVALKKCGFLKQEEYDELMNLLTIPMKCRLLISKISQSGVKAYYVFKKCLSDTKHDSLVKELEEKEKELIFESSRYESLTDKRPRVQKIEENKRASSQEVIDALNDGALNSAQPQPALGKSVLHRLCRDETITKIIKKDLHDGRLIELDKEIVDELRHPDYSVLNTEQRGAFGTVYISKKNVPAFNVRVVLKEINLEKQAGNLTQKLGSITNEKIASRLMHFGIVPLLAYYDDHMNKKYYFVSPYFENGDLFYAIKDDNERLLEKSDIKMNWEKRLKIMYQIACAVDYMHSGNKFRGAILHMDIKSNNIVLDAKFNARLIDFGLARELKDGNENLKTVTPVGTPGYYPFSQHNLLTKQHDYHAFGVVLLELITGVDPSQEHENECWLPLRKWDKELVLEKKLETVWNVHDVLEKAVDIAIECIKSIDTYKSSGLTSTQIAEKLKRKCIKNSALIWEAIPGDNCEICLVNNAMEVGFGPDSGCKPECTRRIRTCCSCMRNSYINPVQCQSCRSTIEPYFNSKWGAVLVAGYDEKNGEIFEKDIIKFREVITSKFLPAMCLNSENVIDILGKQESQSFEEQLNESFEKLRQKDIKTLLFVYSGHHSEERGLEVRGNECYTIDKLSKKLEIWKKNSTSFEKLIVILDCCYAKKLDAIKSLKMIQLNATGQYAEAVASREEGSNFIQYIIQVFTASANGGKCKNNKCDCMSNLNEDFITLVDFLSCLEKHVRNKHLNEKDEYEEPHTNMQDIDTKNTILAYNYNFTVEIKFSLEWSGLPKTISMFPKDLEKFEDLKKHLAAEVIKHALNIKAQDEHRDEILDRIVKLMVLEIDTGPKAKHREEMSLKEQILSAWISKRLLRCTARRLTNIGQGKPAGEFFQDAGYLLSADQKCNPKKPMSKQELKDYTKLLQSERHKRNELCTQFVKNLDNWIIFQTHQLKDNCLDIKIFDMQNGLTLVYMELVQMTGVQETTSNG